MTQKFRAIGFALAAFGLFACNQDEKVAAPSGSEGTGSARFELPAIPAGFLAKTSAGSKAVFSLTISGQGMTPIQKSWTLGNAGGNQVTVTGIPAGFIRTFYGRLSSSSLDTTKKDTGAVYEGWDSAFVDRDQVAEVHLYLRKKGKGSAHVCVDVEGLPPDSSCIPRTHITNFAGCWAVQITKLGKTPKTDTVFKGKLKINQWDTSLSSTITWPSGKRDSSFGYVGQGGDTAFLGYGGGSFRFKGVLDSSGLTLRGDFNDSLRRIAGALVGTSTACDTVVPPNNASACFDVSQTLVKGKSGTGRLSLSSVGNFYGGAFHWNGFPTMNVRGESSLQGSILDSAAISLMGVLPKGMADSSVQQDSMFYRINLPGAGTGKGNIFRLLPTTLSPAGTWTATRSKCTAKDTLP